jgi:hypothetical protein
MGIYWHRNKSFAQDIAGVGQNSAKWGGARQEFRFTSLASAHPVEVNLCSLKGPIGYRDYWSKFIGLKEASRAGPRSAELG